MNKCSNCAAELPDGARFCPQCGEKVAEDPLACPRCGKENPVGARFCAHCGLNFFEKKPPNNIFEPPPTITTEAEISGRFFEVLERKINQEQNGEIMPAYLDRFETSSFKHTFELRVRQLAEQIEAIRQNSIRPQTEAEHLLEDALEGLSDFFLIRHCKDLNEVELPESILKYESIDVDTVDIYQLVMDYLNFPAEEETVYTDFLTMPVELLKNAGNSFLQPAKEEKILFLCDQSMLGNLKEGFAMTDRAIYWKAPLEKARKVPYAQVEKVTPEQEWIEINGFFFNAGHSLNVKLMKLLQKLKSLFR